MKTIPLSEWQTKCWHGCASVNERRDTLYITDMDNESGATCLTPVTVLNEQVTNYIIEKTGNDRFKPYAGPVPNQVRYHIKIEYQFDKDGCHYLYNTSVFSMPELWADTVEEFVANYFKGKNTPVNLEVKAGRSPRNLLPFVI